jgi:hypothetical protein
MIGLVCNPVGTPQITLTLYSANGFQQPQQMYGWSFVNPTMGQASGTEFNFQREIVLCYGQQLTKAAQFATILGLTFPAHEGQQFAVNVEGRSGNTPFMVGSLIVGHIPPAGGMAADHSAAAMLG